MDDKEIKTIEPSRTIPVMDVQPPKTPSSEEAVVTAPVEDTPATDDVSAQVESTTDEVSATPESTEQAEPVTETTSEQSLGTSTENPMAVTPANAGPAKHKAPVGAIVAAIVIALVLAGATIFAYLKTKDQTASKNPQKSAPAVVQQAPVSATEVQQTSSELDDSLKTIDENKDFANTNLDDTTLGL